MARDCAYARLTQVMHDDHVPSAVLRERPASKSTLYTIRFIPTAD